jgi:hypothetical protein
MQCAGTGVLEKVVRTPVGLESILADRRQLRRVGTEGMSVLSMCRRLEARGPVSTGLLQILDGLRGVAVLGVMELESPAINAGTRLGDRAGVSGPHNRRDRGYASPALTRYAARCPAHELESTCGSGLDEANPRRAPEVSLTVRKSYCLVKRLEPDRGYHEPALPSGSTPLNRAVGALATP